MYCPDCGKELNEYQKFCPNCGCNLEEYQENTQQNDSVSSENSNIQAQEADKQKNNKDIFATIATYILILFLAISSILGMLNYQKITKPLEKNYTFQNLGNVTLSTTYSPREQKIYTTLTFNDNIVEDWQVNFLKENDVSCDLFIKNDKAEFHFDYEGLNAEKGHPLVVKFFKNIPRMDYFMNLKIILSDDKADLTLTTPKIFNNNKSTREKIKKAWLAHKAEQEKIKKWQEHVYSNCVYKTKDGTCFTTKVIFPAESEFDTRGVIIHPNKDYWKAANNVCKSWGYKLPNDKELRSLFSDMLGIEINEGLRVETEKLYNSTIPTNYDLLKIIAPRGFVEPWNHSYISWSEIWLWEDSEFDSERGYIRNLTGNSYKQTTEQTYANKKGSQGAAYICVYDPNGKPPTKPIKLKTPKEIIKEQRAQRAKQVQQEQANREKEVVNDLF